jgi:asparagine synthase (glutamine-hydrolysing)
VPPSFKIRGGKLKYLLRLAFADLVPDELLRRRKHGFGVPADRWFREDLKPFASELLLGPDSRIRQHLVQEEVRRLFDDHVRGTAQNGPRLWSLVNLELWLRMLEDGSLSRPFPVEPETASSFSTSTHTPLERRAPAAEGRSGAHEGVTVRP